MLWPSALPRELCERADLAVSVLALLALISAGPGLKDTGSRGMPFLDPLKPIVLWGFGLVAVVGISIIEWDFDNGLA